MILNPFDIFAVAFFAVAWVGYAMAVEGWRGGRSLNGIMHDYRLRWMEQMLAREVRIIDTQIMASLQNGTAFFASTSLLAVGGSLTLLRAADDILRVFADLPLGIETQRGLWEMKVIGLAVIFVYAFFKFAWSYRLFNYAAILLGATPPAEQAQSPEALRHARSVAGMATAAGRHFNRGQRAFFFALGYLGWFWSPSVFILSTAAVLVVMYMRQFRSDGLRSVIALADSGSA
ncbi:DUF599 domain-containing protein [Alsobacter soli]|uniref:DUF599 domain-containing protein n=1 Tax=Alsobacter soli TaxID=2109933 RepID=A0A2T1HN01_9HYPH|nr:DUF599 family protein [Alsobacter soli]PSC03007.1 DUF599 domain-containing protein [Alsobacter soli]